MWKGEREMRSSEKEAIIRNLKYLRRGVVAQSNEASIKADENDIISMYHLCDMSGALKGVEWAFRNVMDTLAGMEVTD